MSGSLCLICLSLVISTVVPHAWCQSHEPDPEEARERPVVPKDSEVERIKPEDPVVRLKGLCRDGWSPGTTKDVSGKEIPICLKINPEALTWSEAQESCRKDYGFLMKFDSSATVDGSDLLTSVILNGITKFWTGMHSENGHLIWDDLIPNQVRPHNRLNNSSVLKRPWTWESREPEKRNQYCGQIDVQTDDDKRRRKRSSDDESNDNNFPAFDLSNLRQMFNNNFRSRDNEFPPTSAFESSLARTQMSDQLGELQSILGLQAEHQIPGSGLPDANIQNGGLATDMPTFEPIANFDQPDTETVTPFDNLNMADVLNTESNENPNSQPTDLLPTVKEVAATIGSNIDNIPTPVPTEAAEKLRKLIQENDDSFKAENSDQGVPQNQESFGSETAVTPPITSVTGSYNGLEVLNVGKSDDSSVVDNTESIGPDGASELKDKIADDNNNLDLTAFTEANVESVLTGGTGGNTMTLDDTDTKGDDLSKQMTNGIIDGSDDKSVSEIVADGLKAAADVASSTDDKPSDNNLGYGQSADLLTNEDVTGALNIKNFIGNNDNAEEFVSDLIGGTGGTELQTQSEENKPDVLTAVSDGTDDSILENIGPLDPFANVNENLNTDLDIVTDKDSNLLGDLDKIPENIMNTEDSGDLNVGFKNQDDVKETLEQIQPDITSISDEPVLDILESNDILPHDNENEASLSQITPKNDDLIESLNENDSQTPSEVVSEFVDNLNDVNDNIDVSDKLEEIGNTGEIQNEVDDLPTITDMPDLNDNHKETMTKEQAEGTEDDKAADELFDDITANDIGDLTNTQETNTPEVERETLNTDFFDDMAERLYGEKRGNDEVENKDIAETIQDSLDKVSDQAEKSLDQELPDEIKTESDTHNVKIFDDINERKSDKNDDIQTKRDSDWSEFDWNNNEQENELENPTSDIDTFDTNDISELVQDEFNTDDNVEGNGGNVELYENFGKENEDDKKQDFVSGVTDDLNDNIDDTFSSQKETDTEIESEVSDSYFEDKEGKQIEIDTEVDTNVPDSYFEDKEEGIYTESDTELETQIPEDREHEKQTETNTDEEKEIPDSYFADKEESDRFDEIPDLAEDVVENDLKTALAPEIESQEMQLSSCEVRLPSVCFGYEVEVMDKASTCENDWYGHVLLDTCYQILDNRMSYGGAVSECKSRNARLVLAGSEFERKFVLIAVQKDGKLFRGTKFWMESLSDKLNCKYFDERGVHTMESCNTQLHAVCVKDAKSLSVYTVKNMPVNNGDVSSYYDDPGVQKIFSSKKEDNSLPCKLTSAASEFPVLWFKDGVVVETKDKYISTDISLYLNAELVSSIAMVTDRNLATPALQGQYWCEVWNRQTLSRKRSKSFNVRFSDVISFHGSMELKAFSQKDELLFNMANRKFPELSAAEADITKVFTDVLPMLQTRLPNVADVFTYVDGIRSNPNVIEYHIYFTLNRDYNSQDEDTVYNRLKAVLRTKLGNRYYMANLPGQTPLSAFRTMSLQSTVSCPAATLQTTRDMNGHTIPVKVFSFPKAGLGEYANSIDNCSVTNQLPSGSARCLGDFYTGAYWGEVVANECREEAGFDEFNNQIWGASPYTDRLTQFAEVTVDAQNVEKLVSEVAQIAKVAPKLTPTDINKIADVLDHTTQVGNLPAKVGEDVLKTVDRLMAISEKEAHIANVETKAANRIIKSLERYAEHADMGTKDQMRLVSDNVVVEIWNLKPSMKPVIGLAAETRSTSLDKPFKTESIATVYNKSQLYDANVDAAIELPAEIFAMKEKGARVSDRLTMMVFRKSKLFKAAITDGGRKMNPTEQQLSNLNSYVISASIAGKKLQNLNEKVKTIFKPIKDVESGRSCVWWDFDMNNFKGGWSDKGCVYDGKVNGRDVCLCDHLTNFAVLIDFYGQAKPIPDHHELSLSIITVLGLSCSILGLSLTIISYVFFRKLRKGRAQQTLFNLSLSLLLSMLVFLVGIKQTHNYFGCVTVAILLHYLILVSFMWMLMEAILQYLTFVKILGTYITRFTLKTVLPAWGLPLVPVIAVLCVDYTLYKGGPNYCWMDLPAFYYAFAIPVTCIIVINLIIFIVTIVSIFRRGKGLRSNQKKQKMAMTNLQAAITSFILLGLTWVFGYLAIADARLIFQYVFTIMNSLQGFFIFILFVVRKKKVREQWYFICCKGIEKDRVSRSLSASNSIPSTYSNGSNRNSRKDPRERDRSDSTKTVQSTYSNSSTGFTNYGYDHGYDFPFSRHDRRAFRKF